MDEQQSSYRQIIKATSLFGGVQVFNIIISIVRSKAIAVLLGPSGMGIAGLLTSTIGVIASVTNFGLGSSAVRDVAAAHSSGDTERMSVVTTVFRKWVWVTGTLGAIVTLIASPWLSELTFGNRNYTLAFIMLSVTLLINQLTSGQNVLLQGTRKLKYLAAANMIGSTVSLVVTLPIYYLYGMNGIVPAIVIMSLLTLVVSFYFANKLNIPKALVTTKIIISEGKGMLRLGFMLSLSGLIAVFGAYLLRIYISNTGTIEDVGLYSAGFAIIGTYVGLIFSAMGSDFYPRLASIAKDNEQANALINQQAEIALLILGPILIAFILFIQWIVILLYSQQFTPINDMIIWAALGMFFKAGSWPIGFQFLANGASKLYFWSELVTNVYLLIFNILGYYFFGLEGLGISFLATYIIYFFQVYYISNKLYSFKYNSGFLKIMFFGITLGVVSLFLTKYVVSFWSYTIGIIILLGSVVFSFSMLNAKLGLLKKK